MKAAVKKFMNVRLILPCLIFFTGCASIGPRTVSNDSFDYTNVLAESWKQRMLINMVRLRYGDTPVFLDVASVINQYSVETRGQAGMDWRAPYSVRPDGVGVVGSATYYDRPTITYIPMSGERFARSLMRPLPPPAVMSMIEAGYPVDLVLRICVESVNGIRNNFESSLRGQPASKEFYPMLEALRRIQNSGAISLWVKNTEGKEATVMTMRGKVDGSVSKDSAFVRQTLGLDPEEEEFHVVYASRAENDKELAILTRSILQIINNLATGIEVPDAHVDEAVVRRPEAVSDPNETPVQPLIRIQSAVSKPEHAFAAVPYQGYWFWIDNRDLKSKSLFTFILFLFSLTETAGSEGAPVVTISAGG